MHLTNKEISSLPFRSYRKVASFRLRARRLTQEDVEQRGGVIHTMEGPVAFQPGDYLARGIQGEEYPIRPEAFAMLYDVDTLEPDTEGFASYRSAPLLHQAAQITEPFTVERADGGLFTGKAGDYVMRTVGLEGAGSLTAPSLSRFMSGLVTCNSNSTRLRKNQDMLHSTAVASMQFGRVSIRPFLNPVTESMQHFVTQHSRWHLRYLEFGEDFPHEWK